MSHIIRPFRREDNDEIVSIVKAVMTEFEADPKTTVLGDPRLLTMYDNYGEEGAAYFIAEMNGEIAGGAGIKKLDGGDGSICELQRMFLLPPARGKGIGKELMIKCIDKARKKGYKTIYLESLSQMHNAVKLYTSFGFERVPRALGDTGHGGCNVFMVLDI